MSKTMQLPLTRKSVNCYWSMQGSSTYENFEWYNDTSCVRYATGQQSQNYYWTDTCYAIVVPAGSIDQLLPAGSELIGLTIKLYNPASGVMKCHLANSSLVGETAQNAFTTAQSYVRSSGNLMMTVSSLETGTVNVAADETETIADILANGVIVSYGGDGQNTRVYIGPQIIAEYIDPTAPPEIGITSPADLSNRIASEALTVAWTYSQDAGTPQTAYLIEASTDEGGTWTTAASATSPAAHHTFAADTFAGGRLWLRLTVSTQYASSEPAIVRVNMRANPATSDVDCDGKPHPTVSWTGADQTAYQVRFDTWDSGARFGSEEELTIPRVYAAGIYPVTVRTQTSNGDWSDWTDTLWAEIANTDPGYTVALTVTPDAASAVCRWSAVTGAAGYVLLRGGVQIYAGTGTMFRDDLGMPGDVYTLRAVSAAGYYTGSEPVTFAPDLRCDVLRPLDDPDAAWIAVKWSLSPRSRSYDRSVDTTFRHYAGRERPVAVSSGAVNRTMRTTAAYKTRAEAEAILALAGRPVVYKDRNGDRIIGILNPAGYDSERVYSVDISITEIDWPEEADYVPGI